jgi:DNA-binding NtrC family response regulator
VIFLDGSVRFSLQKRGWKFSREKFPMKDRPKLLIVHPDSGISSLLTRLLSAVGYAIQSVRTGEDAVDHVSLGEVGVVLLELDLPGMSGLETLRALRALGTAPQVVVTTREATVDTAAEAARQGAFDFVPQPFDPKELTHIVRAAYEETQRHRQTRTLESVLKSHDPFPEIIGRSAGIRRVLALVHKAAPTHSPVLIQGESGTGKELVARALHVNSPRAEAPLTIVDCGALQDTLLESELFGHERGAFTGAHGLKHGLFETANHGTLFLDEIGEMSPATQVKVLRALQSGEFRRLGSNRHIRADLRIIAATNKDLREEVRRGHFREDLYYRIAVIEIAMPSLRERAEDIPLLVEHFLRQSPYGGRDRLTVTPDAMACLMAYPWPGNIRELRNCIERLSVLAENQVLSVEALPPSIVSSARAARDPIVQDDLPLEEVERLHILRTLERHRGNKKRAAAVLGIDTKTLYNKLRRYGVAVGARGDGETRAGSPGSPA